MSVNNETEILTVQADLGKAKLRIINGYGPQEDDNNQAVLDFWQELEAEIMKAKDNNCSIIIEMDANAKVGSSVIKNDPHKRTQNGQLLLDVINRQNLTVVNSLDICKGTITRERKVENKEEKSIIDFIIICDKMLTFLTEMIIDEARVHTLARYSKTK